MGSEMCIRDSSDDRGARDTTRPPLPDPLPSPVVDNHCHLDIQDGDSWLDTDTALKLATSVGVPRIVQIGCDLPGARWAVETATTYDAIVAGVAIHPNEAPRLEAEGELDAALTEIERLATPSTCVRAVGETGLDYYRDHAPREDQVRAFAAQMGLARRVGKPLVIHTRAAEDLSLIHI